MATELDLGLRNVTIFCGPSGGYVSEGLNATTVYITFPWVLLSNPIRDSPRSRVYDRVCGIGEYLGRLFS